MLLGGARGSCDFAQDDMARAVILRKVAGSTPARMASSVAAI
jgi:hypothetical protein